MPDWLLFSLFLLASWYLLSKASVGARWCLPHVGPAWEVGFTPPDPASTTLATTQLYQLLLLILIATIYWFPDLNPVLGLWQSDLTLSFLILSVTHWVHNTSCHVSRNDPVCCNTCRTAWAEEQQSWLGNVYINEVREVRTWTLK